MGFFSDLRWKFTKIGKWIMLRLLLLRERL